MADRAAIEQLKADRSRLVAALTDAGARIVGDKVGCPFHDDQHPSGGVYEREGAWWFRCHGCGFGGDVLGVTRKVHGCDFKGALELLGLSNGKTSTPSVERTPAAQDARNGSGLTDSAPQLARDAQTQLLRDPDVLRHLWTTRGIDRATAERFRVGIIGEPGRRFWTFPVADKCGQVVAVKAHRADGQSDKSWWSPKGAGRSHLWPVDLSHDGPAWVCPGELKALAVIVSGRPALGITSGEGSRDHPADLPAPALELLRGHTVAIAPDDDEVGRAWGEHVRQQLGAGGFDARIVDLDLDAAAGLKDIGDFIVRMYQDGKDGAAVAATLDERYRRSDPWYGTSIGELWSSGRMWTPVTYIPTGLRALDSVTGGGLRTRGATMLVGKTNHAKSQLAVQIAVNGAKGRVAVGFFSLELGADEVAQLVAAQLGDIPRLALATGNLQGDYADRLRRVTTEHADIPLCILDDERWPGGLTRDTLATLVADGVTRFGWRMVVVDYLGLLCSPESDRDQFASDILNSTALRKLARRHDVALVVVAALRKSQAVKHTEPSALSIDDVAGAGRLVYDSQNVLLVSREHGDGDSGIVHVRPLKMRYAPMKDDLDLQFRWRPCTGLITDLEGAE